MELQLHNGGAVKVADSAFGQEYNEALVHQVVTAYLAGGRAGTKAQKTRAAVRGGGIKPWRQKGTGRARHGSIRSPIWRGGGRAFAAQPRDHAQKVNRKMYRAAMRALVSELARQGRLIVVESLAVDTPKTKAFAAQLVGLGVRDVLVLVEGFDENLALASRNLPNVGICEAKDADPVNLIRYEHVLATVPALRQLEERLA
jgi:large subunit ribosomal protein L4